MDTTPETPKTNEIEKANIKQELVRMDPVEYKKLHDFVDAEKFWQLDRAIEKAGGKPLEKFFQEWFTAHLFLNSLKESGGLPERGMKFLRQSIKRLSKITEADKS